MANTKKGTRSNSAKQKPGQKQTKSAPQGKPKAQGNEIKGIALIAVGLFMGFTFWFDTMGVVGEFIRTVMMGIFGSAAWISSIIIMWMGLNLIIDKREKSQSYKPWLFLGLMLFVSVITALIDDQCDIRSFAVSKLFDEGNRAVGGGVFGGGISVLLCSLIGKIGLWIFSVSGLLILTLILTGVSLGKILRAFGVKIQTGSQNLKEAQKLKRAERLAAREAAIEEEKFRAAEENIQNTEKIKNIDIADADIVRNTAEDESGKRRRKKKADESLNEVTPVPFVLTEDSFPQFADYVEGESDGGDDVSLREDAPFHPKDVKTGVITPLGGGENLLDTNAGGALTPLPDENGNFKEKDAEFEPPTLESMKEKLDPATKQAIDSGAPLDRAVSEGRKILRGEAEEAANHISNMVEKTAEKVKIINYKLPPVSLLKKSEPKAQNKAEIKNELEEKANRLLKTLASFRVDAKILNITQGPTVTRFELQPGPGVKVSKITNLSNDIALSLAAIGVRIEAPIPGKSAIGIEIPNESPSPVHIREVLDTDTFKKFKSKTAFALGKDISGATVIADIAQFPHVLIAGATGSGKSVCINALIASILYKARPDEVKLIMIDPKMVELGVYNGIPHLLIPVVTNPKHAAGALNWAVSEMKNRYNMLKDNKVRNLSGYNKLMEEMGTPERKMPEIVIIIDELADLMTAARNEVETSINSLAALARAAGMYLVIATQRPSVDVITGVIKANIPSRIAFAVSSHTDSRTIIDTVGAEKLLGKGDMLYFPRGATKPTRIQGNFLSDSEIESIIDFIKGQYEAEYDESIIEQIEREPEENTSGGGDSEPISQERDDLFVKAAEMVIDSGQASVAMFQRKYKIGYQRAARLIDRMEELKIIGPYEGTKPRQVLMTRQQFNEMLFGDE